MGLKFIHTADWQIGKPYHSVEEETKRHLLQQERFEAIARIGQAAKDHGAEFIVVAGDLFDSPTPTKSTVAATCRAIGLLGVPVYVIPGNHDHGGEGGLWTQPFFLQEQQALAPNMKVLLSSEPLDAGKAMIFPCPLLRRHETSDTTGWLRGFDFQSTEAPDKPRIVLAHGSVQGFGGASDDEDSTPTNFLDLGKLALAEIDYVALGDWHGTKEISEKAWYSGTHETDRFIKGNDHDPGNVLLVEVGRGAKPKVEVLRTRGLKWHSLDFTFHTDADVDSFEKEIRDLVGDRVSEDLLRLNLKGSLGIEKMGVLENHIETLSARLIRLKMTDETVVNPTDEELNALTKNQDDPLVAKVAQRLCDRIAGNGNDADVARMALRELYLAKHS